VIVDSYYVWKLAIPSAELAARFKQAIPAVTVAHYEIVRGVVDFLLPLLLGVNLLLVATRSRRARIVAWLNRRWVSASMTAAVALTMAFVFSAMVGQWRATIEGLDLQFFGAKLQQEEEEGRYDQVVEGFLGLLRSRPELASKPAWQRRLARFYRITGQTARERESWALLAGALGTPWQDDDPKSYLAVGSDFARLGLFREDAVAVFHAGLERFPDDGELVTALAGLLRQMGFDAEAGAVEARAMGYDDAVGPPPAAEPAPTLPPPQG